MEILRDLTIKKFHEGLTAKRFSALEITQAFFKHIKASDTELGAYLNLNEEMALKEAEVVDIAVAKDEPIGTLAGAPLAIKDNILIKGLPATAASKILANYTASYDAGVIQKLKAEKAVFLGKTNLDELAMGSSTENSGFRLTRNPHNLGRVPGGSSGGSCAAVAAHMAIAALGSDTGGSIRLPANFCGVVGLNPTYGAVSRSGLISMASSLDQIGPIAKTVEDAAILFKAISGEDSMDSTCASPETSTRRASVSTEHTEHGDELLNPDLQKIKQLTVGLPEEYFADGLSPDVRDGVDCAIKKIKSLNLRFKKVSLPHTKYALSCYYIIVPAEISSNLARLDGVRYSRLNGLEPKNLIEIYAKQRGRGFGAEVKRRIILGTFVLSSGYYDAYYEKAQKVRTLVKKDFAEAFERVDVILAPVAPTSAFKIGEKTNDPLSMYLADVFTIPVKMAGLPAISIPVKKYPYPNAAKELPIGFQLIGKHFREADILGLGQYYEKIEPISKVGI